MGIFDNEILLLILFLLPLFAIIHLVFIRLSCSREEEREKVKHIRFSWSLAIFIYSLVLYSNFDIWNSTFQYISHMNWFHRFNIDLVYGVDGISLWFIILTAFLIPFCILCRWKSIIYWKLEFIAALFTVEVLLFQVFCILDILLFYVFFESILIPMFFIIGIWGSRERKIRAAYQFFLYTFSGSLLMLVAILYLYTRVGSTSYFVLLNVEFPRKVELLLWLAFFISFAVKIPLIPVHIWLPEAHVEAPTAGSVLLAGVLLKMGTYGLIRFNLPLFCEASYYFAPMVITIGAIGVIYASFTTLRQIDLKKIIAYSSVAHMGLVTMAIFTKNIYGLEGRVALMLSHGLVSSGLFLCVGILYDRYGTRIIAYYGGLIAFMPLFGLFFMILNLANMGFPGTRAFVGEFLSLLGIFGHNTLAAVIASTSMVFRAAYSVWLYNRVMFGPISLRISTRYNKNNIEIKTPLEFKIPFMSKWEVFLQGFGDLNKREFWYLFIIIFLVIIFGILPTPTLEVMHIRVTSNILLSGGGPTEFEPFWFRLIQGGEW